MRCQNRRHRPTVPALAALLPLLASSLACSPAAPTGGTAGGAAESDVGLIVLIVVDQMIPQQLTRLEPWLDGGFGRFLADGQVWLNASHDHGISETAPGHATLATGTFPSTHGIIANQWWSPEGKSVYCVDDPNVTFVGGELNRRTEPRSPANLAAPGFSDYLEQADPLAQSVSISAKDRAAILGMGWVGEAYWWDMVGRGFVSSTWYGDQLPDWVQAWNLDWIERARGNGLSWESTLPADIGKAGTAIDDREGENKYWGRRAFPHTGPDLSPDPLGREMIQAAQWFYQNHFADQFTIELAQRAIQAKQLGADEHVDYLFVGLSACDNAGHLFGPMSHEVTDILLRTDEHLGHFLDYLDETVGEGRWIAALTSDHGVLELPEALRDRGIDAQRVPGRAFLDENMVAVRETLAADLGGDYVATARFDGIRFSESKLSAAGIDPAAARAAGARALRRETGGFYAYALTAEDLVATTETSDEIQQLMAHSYYPGRSPDVSMVIKPKHVVMRVGTAHGSPWDYDREVPLIFLGPGFDAMQIHEPCHTVDVLPTLLDHAGLPVPAGIDGRALGAR